MRKSPAILILPLLAIGLAACSPAALETASTAEPISTDTAETPAADPIFPSDDAALAAADAAFQRFIAVTNTIEADGGDGTDALAGVVSGDLLTQMTSAYEQMRSAGVHSVGATTVDGATFAGRTMDGDTETVTIDACVDTSATTMVDATGAEQNSPDSRTRTPFEIEVSATSATVATVVNLGPTSDTEGC